MDCSAVWRLKKLCMSKSSTIRNDHPGRERSASVGSQKAANREAVAPDLDRLIHERKIPEEEIAVKYFVS